MRYETERYRSDIACNCDGLGYLGCGGIDTGYVVRELVIELLFFCILFAALGIAVAILLVIAEVASRVFLSFSAHIVCRRLHLLHATAASGVVSAIHNS